MGTGTRAGAGPGTVAGTGPRSGAGPRCPGAGTGPVPRAVAGTGAGTEVRAEIRTRLSDQPEPVLAGTHKMHWTHHIACNPCKVAFKSRIVLISKSGGLETGTGGLETGTANFQLKNSGTTFVLCLCSIPLQTSSPAAYRNWQVLQVIFYSLSPVISFRGVCN
jgi:hypothetical protein